MEIFTTFPFYLYFDHSQILYKHYIYCLEWKYDIPYFILYRIFALMKLKLVCFILCIIYAIYYLVVVIVNKMAFPAWYANNFPQKSIKDLRKISLITRNLNETITLAIYQPTTCNNFDKTSRPIVIYSHGNGENIFSIDDQMQIFSDIFCCTFVSFDQCGYGISTGTPTESALLLSERLVFEYIIKEFQVVENQIILWGQSIGTVAAIHLGQHQKVKAVIAQSAPASAFDCVFKTHPIILSFLNQFKSYDRIKNIQTKILLIHGENDKIVPFRNGIKLAKSYSGSTISFDSYNTLGVKSFNKDNLTFYAIKGADHNNIDYYFREQLIHCVYDLFGLPMDKPIPNSE